jgi:hypothetical protein
VNAYRAAGGIYAARFIYVDPKYISLKWYFELRIRSREFIVPHLPEANTFAIFKGIPSDDDSGKVVRHFVTLR